MKILRTTKGIIIVIEQNEIHFYNSKDILKKERIILSFSILILVALNIFFGKSYDNLLWLSLWIFLFITWIAYLLFHIFKSRYPDVIKFVDIHKIRHVRKNKAVSLCICTRDYSIKFKIKEDEAIDNSILDYFKNNGVEVEEIIR